MSNVTRLAVCVTSLQYSGNSRDRFISFRRNLNSVSPAWKFLSFSEVFDKSDSVLFKMYTKSKFYDGRIET